MYYWYTLFFDSTMFFYGQCALLLAFYNACIWCVEEVPLLIQQGWGIWWDKKHRINWRSSRGTPRKRRNYCKRYYSRSRKRGNRVCWKTANFKYKANNKPGVRAHASTREHVSDGRNTAKYDQESLPHSCTGTVPNTSAIGKGPSCLPCTTEYDTDSKWVGIDSLSTYCITNDMSDFSKDPTPIRREVRGIQSEPALITYVGVGRFKITDELGQVCELPVERLYYCKSAPVKILSPQHLDKMWREQNKKNKFEATINSDGCVINWTLNGSYHNKIIKIDGKTGVPVCKTAPGFKAAHDYFAANALAFADESNMIVALSAHNKQFIDEPVLKETLDINIDDVKKEPVEISFYDEKTTTVEVDKDSDSMDSSSLMLYLHHKLGHLPFSVMRNMARVGLLPKKIYNCREPKCSSCLFGAATKRAWRTKVPTNQIGTRYKITAPGDCISVDQFESPVPGLVAQIKGIPTVARYTSGTVFIDHFSDVTYVHIQKSLSALETIQAKEAFERWSSSHGVTIRHYHADNGRFAENAFLKHIQESKQTISFCGVNAHFQNGRAERRIRTLQDQARCQIIHAKMRWPMAISTHLWPYAVRNVFDILNETCYKDNKKTRLEVFSGTDVSPNMRHHHHFGVPVYVLDNHLQSGFKIGKWLPRSRVGIYLGKSPRHARTVALVLNPRTGNVSPQFHVKFDDLFETVKGVSDDAHGIWKSKCGFSKENPKGANKCPDAQITPSNEGNVNNAIERELVEQEEIMAHEGAEQDDFPGEMEAELPDPEPPDVIHPTRRSTRAWKPSLKILESIQQDELVLSTIDEENEVLKYTGTHPTMIDEVHSISLLSHVDKDTMYWDQAMHAKDSMQFVKAAMDEVQSHVDNKHWITVSLKDIPKGIKILDCVWSMKRKRRLLTNEVYKHKARLNIHGGQQELGVNYWESYAPVVTWAAIRLLLVLSIICGWHSVQIDFVLAYPQAPVECDLYMRIPKGFTIDGVTRETHALKLLQNLYGQKQAGRVWNKHLHEILLELGWTQSTADDCVYYKGDVIFCVYVDDGIFFSINKESIDKCIQEIQAKFNISIEGDVCDYVGVNIERKEDGSIHMTQPQLIQSIISELNFLDTTKPAATPAYSSTTLSAGKDKPEHKADWSYR